MIMALAVSDAANKVVGKESVAMEAYSRALLQIPMTISDNGGFDSSYLITSLRAAHIEGKVSAGLGNY